MAKSPGLTKDDPIYREIEQIVQSEDGWKAAEQATIKGCPALCGVDKILRERLGARYSPADQGTATAGDMVAKLMRSKGYKEAGQKPCPHDWNCVAQTGIVWVGKG